MPEPDEIEWKLAEAQALVADEIPVDGHAAPAAAGELQLVAARLILALLMQPDAVILDGIFSNWHRDDQVRLARVIDACVNRLPLRPFVLVDVVQAATGLFPSTVIELENV